MLVPQRHSSSTDYRYGFQGQEKDDEIKGEGNSLNYTFRMHDPRVGRFFAVDPLTHKYPHYTPYSFSGNKVIAFVELEGLEESRINATIDWNTAVKLSGKDATSEQILKKYNEIHFAASKQFAVAAFKLPFPAGGAARDFIEHYAYGDGEPLKLSKEQMLEVYPLVTPDGSSVDLSLSTIDFKMESGDKVNFSKTTYVYSGTPGTLGRTHVTVEGEISYDPKTETKLFIGKVKFNDTYDFNASDRDFTAEGQTTIGRLFLPGKGYKMTGELPVRQFEGGEILLNDGSGVSPKNIPKPDHNKEFTEVKATTGEVGKDIKE
jgi:RHS repeat-associated protein